MSPSFIKYYFLLFSCLYIYIKIINVPEPRKDIFYCAAYSAAVSPVIVIIRSSFSFVTLLVLILFVLLFTKTKYRNSFTLNFCTSVLAFGIGYILSLLSAIIVSALFLPVIRFAGYSVPDSLLSLTVGIMQIFLSKMFFRIKRLQKGIPSFMKRISGDVGVFISILIVQLASLAYIKEKTYSLSIQLICLTVTIGLCLFYWLRRYITNEYLQRAQDRFSNILESELKKEKSEIEHLSKIIHKDNKLIKALELSMRQLQQENLNDQQINLMEELERLSKERGEILENYKHGERFQSHTRIFVVDTIINYLVSKAGQLDTVFEVSVFGDITFMTGQIIDKNDLGTLVADLGENALKAVSETEHKNVLMLLGVKENCFSLDFYDSGIDFCRETVEKLGKERFTTHKADGGSGIGLITTVEISRKYMASFEIDELSMPGIYRKRVSVIFDNKSQIRIFTDRDELFAAGRLRPTELIIISSEKSSEA